MGHLCGRLIHLPATFLKIAIIISPVPAFGHGTQILVSTPVSPPREFFWVPLAFLAATIFWFLLISRRSGQYPWKRFVKMFLLGVFVPWLSGFLVLLIDNTSPTSIGPPGAAFYGYGWADVGVEFMGFNLFALSVYAFFQFLVFEDTSDRGTFWPGFYVGGTLVIYLLLLVPFISSGALTHGWHGIYTHMHCGKRLDYLAEGLARFVHDHGQTFPIAKDSHDLEPMIDTDELKERYGAWRFRDLFICPVEDSLEKEPQPYEWNQNVSGISLEEASRLPPETPVLTCYRKHYTHEGVLTISDVVAAYAEIEAATE